MNTYVFGRTGNKYGGYITSLPICVCCRSSVFTVPLLELLLLTLMEMGANIYIYMSIQGVRAVTVYS